MRVLYLTLAYHGGGAERCSRDLFDLMPKLGVERHMFVCARSVSDPPQVRALQTRPERYLKVLQYFNQPLDWCHLGSIRALDAIQPGDFDVVHAHNLHGNWLSLKAVQRLARRIPMVWTLHDEWAVRGGRYYKVPEELGAARIAEWFSGPNAHYNPAPARIERQKAFLDRWMPRPAAIISPSNYLADLARAYPAFEAAAVTVIHNGASLLERPEIKTARVEAKGSFGIDPQDKVILLAAADLESPFKGVRLALDMLKLLPKPGLRLLVLGRNPEPLIRQSPVPVTAPGFVSDAGMLARAYRAADLMLMPSIAENFGYVALESLACETPVLAFDVGGNRDAIGNDERGLLAKPFDVEGMARAASRLLDEPGLAEKLGRNGAKWVAERCSMQQFAAAHLQLYQDVASKRPVGNRL